MNLDDVLDRAQPITETVRLCLDGKTVAHIGELEAELADARAADERDNREPQAPAVADQIVELREQVKAAEVTFTFTSIGRRAWTDLIARHPPTDEQRASNLDHNPVTFQTAAVAASCVDPVVTADSVARLERTVSAGQWMVLYGACVAANAGVGGVGESVAAYALARGSRPNSTTAPPEASPAASS